MNALKPKRTQPVQPDLFGKPEPHDAGQILLDGLAAYRKGDTVAFVTRWGLSWQEHGAMLVICGLLDRITRRL